MGFLPYGRHDIRPEDVEAVKAVLESGFLTTGPAVERFERRLADTVAVPHAHAVNSGTAALHLAYAVLDVGAEDLVVVPSITFAATANAALYLGAQLGFADVAPDTGLMTPDTLDEALVRLTAAGSRPRLVVPVHLGGQTTDLGALAQVSADHGAELVEDAAHAIGTVCHDGDEGAYPVGACRHSRLTCFSFHPVKTVAMGEGGAVTTTDATLARRVALLRSHALERDPARWTAGGPGWDAQGQPNPWFYEIAALGYNYRASELQCALGASQLGHLADFAARRRDLRSRYVQRLGLLHPMVQPVPATPFSRAVWHLMTVLIDFPAVETDRATVMRRLRARGIGTQVHYVPLHRQPLYQEVLHRQGTPSPPLPGADAYYARCLTLPLFPSMTDADVDCVVEALAASLRA